MALLLVAACWWLVLGGCGSAFFEGGGFLPLASVVAATAVAVGITTLVTVRSGGECWISSVYISIR